MTNAADVRAEVAALRAELAEISGRLDLLRDAHRDELVRNRRAAFTAARLMRRLCERHLALRRDMTAGLAEASAAAAGNAGLVRDLAEGVAEQGRDTVTAIAGLARHVGLAPAAADPLRPSDN